MKRANFFVGVLISFISAPTWSSGIVTISGKLTSMTETSYVVETKSSIYAIKRNAVSLGEREKINHVDILVSLAVPLEAVESVKTKKSIVKK